MQIYLFSTLFKIEGSADRTKKPYVRAGSSTQSVKLQTSGSGSVHSRGDNLPKNHGGRTTKNSLKALQPPIAEISPPTHPVVANFENSAPALEKIILVLTNHNCQPCQPSVSLETFQISQLEFSCHTRPHPRQFL